MHLSYLGYVEGIFVKEPNNHEVNGNGADHTGRQSFRIN